MANKLPHPLNSKRKGKWTQELSPGSLRNYTPPQPDDTGNRAQRRAAKKRKNK